MDKVIEKLYDVLNHIYNTETNDAIEIIIDDLIEFKENLIGSLEAIDPINGIDDVMEDIDLLIEKINGDIDW